MQTVSSNDTPFACDMTALNEAQKNRVLELLEQLKNNRQEVVELSDGFAFRYQMDSETFLGAAEFIACERLCCPFFGFELEVEKEGGSMWLRLNGRDGIKDFIRLEFSL